MNSAASRRRSQSRLRPSVTAATARKRPSGDSASDVVISLRISRPRIEPGVGRGSVKRTGSPATAGGRRHSNTPKVTAMRAEGGLRSRPPGGRALAHRGGARRFAASGFNPLDLVRQISCRLPSPLGIFFQTLPHDAFERRRSEWLQGARRRRIRRHDRRYQGGLAAAAKARRPGDHLASTAPKRRCPCARRRPCLRAAPAHTAAFQNRASPDSDCACVTLSTLTSSDDRNLANPKSSSLTPVLVTMMLAGEGLDARCPDGAPYRGPRRCRWRA